MLVFAFFNSLLFQGMNLHNLVREFEMDTGSGTELNLLSLADDLQ